MSIQSNINQGLAVGTALLSQTPKAAEVKETKAATKELKGIAKADKELLEGAAFGAKARALVTEAPELGGEPGAGAKEWGIAAQTTERSVSNAERALELKTKLGTATYEDYAMLEERRRILADERAKSKVQSKISQKKEMKDYIKGVTTNYMNLLKEGNNGNNKTSN